MKSTLTNLWAYITSPLVKSKSAAQADEKTVKALGFMASSLLIIGLVTSWLAVFPFVVQVVSTFAPAWVGYTSAVAVCVTLSLLCDKPLGVFVPAFFEKMTAIIQGESSAVSIVKAAFLISASVCLGYLTMHLSNTGGTLTAKMLFEHERPVQNGLAAVQTDSMKRAALASVEKANQAELNAAKDKDNGIVKNADTQLEKAVYLLHKKYPHAKTNKWEGDQLAKETGEAKRLHETRCQMATNADLVRQKINGQIYETSQSFEAMQQANEANYKTALADYERKVSVANALLRDLGYYSTPLFFVVCAMMVVMSLKDGSANTQQPPHKTSGSTGSMPPPFATITKHLTQYLSRLADAVKADNIDSIRTNATNILAIYDQAEFHYSSEFAAMQKRHAVQYPIWERSEIEQYANF